MFGISPFEFLGLKFNYSTLHNYRHKPKIAEKYRLSTEREGCTHQIGRLNRSGAPIGKVGKTPNGKVKIEGAHQLGMSNAPNGRVKLKSAS